MDWIKFCSYAIAIFWIWASLPLHSWSLGWTLVRFKFHPCFWSAFYELLWSSSKGCWGSWLGFRIKGHDNMCQLIDLDACCHEKYHILSLIICFYVRPRHMCDCHIFWKSNILLTLIHAFPQRSSSSFHDDFVWGWTKISNIRRSTFKVPCSQILAS